MRLLTLISVAVVCAVCWYHRRAEYSAERAMTAIFTGDAVGLETEIRSGLPLNARDEQGRTLLFHAVSSHHPECVKLLLARGADPNTSDEWGWSPLIFAAVIGNAPIVRALLEADADPWHVANAGYDAERAARNTGYEGVADLILRAKG